MSLRGRKPEAIQSLPIYSGRKSVDYLPIKMSEMSDFGNKNVRKKTFEVVKLTHKCKQIPNYTMGQN